MFDDIPDSTLGQARMMENILLSACEGKLGSEGMYFQLRGMLISDNTIKALLPEFVRTCRDLDHFLDVRQRAADRHGCPLGEA